MVDLLGTPSAGKDETRAALLRAHAHSDARLITAARLTEYHFQVGVAEADVATVLAELETDLDVTLSGDLWSLTDQGLQTAREHPSPRHRVSIS